MTGTHASRTPVQNKRETTTKRADDASGNVRNTYCVTDRLVHWEPTGGNSSGKLGTHGEFMAKLKGFGVRTKISSGTHRGTYRLRTRR